MSGLVAEHISQNSILRSVFLYFWLLDVAKTRAAAQLMDEIAILEGPIDDYGGLMRASAVATAGQNVT